MEIKAIIRRVKMRRLLFVMLLCVSFRPIHLLAEEQTISYTVNTVPSTKQVDTKKTYFDVKINPEESEELVVQVHNSSNTPVILSIDVETAKTNSNGVVEYGKYNGYYSKSLPFKVEDVVEYPSEVKVEAGETKEIPFLVQMPKSEYQGVVAGGITIQEKKDEQKQSESSMAINNEYSYQIALVLHGKQSNVAPNLIFNELQVGQKNYRNAFYMTLENQSLTYINQAKFKAKVSKNGKKLELVNAEKDNIQVAPSSMIKYPILLGGNLLENGIYDVELQVTSGENTWLYTKQIEVKKDQASKLNKQDVTLESRFPYRYLLIIVVIILGWAYYAKRKKGTESKF